PARARRKVAAVRERSRLLSGGQGRRYVLDVPPCAGDNANSTLPDGQPGTGAGSPGGRTQDPRHPPSKESPARPSKRPPARGKWSYRAARNWISTGPSGGVTIMAGAGPLQPRGHGCKRDGGTASVEAAKLP